RLDPADVRAINAAIMLPGTTVATCEHDHHGRERWRIVETFRSRSLTLTGRAVIARKAILAAHDRDLRTYGFRYWETRRGYPIFELLSHDVDCELDCRIHGTDDGTTTKREGH